MMIGEAAARIPDAYKIKHGQINWRQKKVFETLLSMNISELTIALCGISYN